ncbi:MAG: carbon-nitrogen hydrolase family protein [Armatimonadota bacterium]
MRVGLAQYGATSDKAANLARALVATAEAADRGVDLLVFPEVFMHRRAEEDSTPPAEIAETLDGPFMSSVARAAAEHRLHLVMGMAEQAPGEPYRAYNTAVLLAPTGERLAVYRKVHLYDAFNGRESERVIPADDPPPVADTPLGRIGLQICYDVRFPEWSRMLALRGAEMIVMPTSWVGGPMKEEHWITLVRARAIENICWMIAADQILPDRIGRSLVVDPMGVVVVDGGEEAGLIVVDIDPERVRRVRQKNPALQHRRPDLYGPVAQQPTPSVARR